MMSKGTHEFTPDPRNAEIRISVNGKLHARKEAVVSVFDSGFILGDGVWEGMRLVNGGIPFLRSHIERLYEGAKAIYMDIGVPPGELVERLFACLDANGMQDGVHVRLMVTRGVKSTPYQDPRVTIGPPTIVIIPEYKLPNPEIAQRGLRLFTVNVRRGYPDVQDQKLNSHSKLNCITACRQCWRRRSFDARSPRLCRDLQFDAFFHRSPRRGLDIYRSILHSRHHAQQHDPALPGGGRAGLREILLALRRLWGG
jgi:branched-chain amino acid aminotransferase